MGEMDVDEGVEDQGTEDQGAEEQATEVTKRIYCEC